MEMRHDSYGLAQRCSVCHKIETGWERSVQTCVREIHFQSMWWFIYGCDS